jgi:hypothetical protein
LQIVHCVVMGYTYMPLLLLVLLLLLLRRPPA